eukprot:COSAG01_NODE_26976_length_697_cov_80.749164_1_plen_200_part_00
MVAPCVATAGAGRRGDSPSSADLACFDIDGSSAPADSFSCDAAVAAALGDAVDGGCGCCRRGASRSRLLGVPMAPPAPPGCWLAGAQSRRSLTGTVEGVGNRGTTDEGPATAAASLASAAEARMAPWVLVIASSLPLAVVICTACSTRSDMSVGQLEAAQATLSTASLDERRACVRCCGCGGVCGCTATCQCSPVCLCG